MKNNRNPLYSALRYALAAGVASGVGATGAAVAQDEDVAELERVEVTGSRIKRTDIEGAAPVTMLDREDLERTGLKDLGKIIQALPSFTASPASTQTNNGGAGSTLVDLRGFGSTRTLVLINGRRAAFAGDLTAIPTSIIERVEILKDGASAVYGADAVAGVVNIITRDDFEGAEFEGQFRYFDDSGTTEESVSMLIGGNSDRGNFVLGAEYFDIEGVTQGQITDNEVFQDAFTILTPDAYREAGGSGNFRPGMPGLISLGSTRVPEGVFNSPGFPGSGLTLRDGADGTSPDDFRPFIAGGPNNDTYNYAPVNYMQTPNERVNLFAQGRYELFDNLDVFASGFFQNRKSEQLLAPLPYDTNFNPGFVVDTRSDGSPIIGVPAENAYNPFGVDITRVRRRMVETGGRSFNQDVNRFQIVTGFEGAFEAGGRFFDYSLSYNFSRSHTSNTDFGQFLGARLEQAMGPSFFNDQGEAVCGTPEDPIVGCVPINFFGGPGTVTDEMINYISKPVTDLLTTQTQVVNGVITGTAFDLPAGPLGFAVGFEWRDQDLSSIPAAAKAIAAVTGNSFAGTEGFKRITSGFVEFNVPLLADMPGVELLELSLGGRADSFKNVSDDATTFQAGLRWQPTSDLLVRGTFSEVFREPTIFNLFGGAADSFPTAGDPCQSFSSLTAAQIQNCVDNGVPADGSYVQVDSQPRTTVGGNPGVLPEDGEVKTIGIAWSPGFVEGLNLTVDWWDIQVDNSIGSLSAATILTECALNGQFCDLVNRFPDGTVNRIDARTRNLGTLTGSGVDLEVAYDLNTDYGLFSSRLQTSYLDDRQTQPFPGAPFVDQDGNFDILQVPAGSGLDAAYPHWQVFYDLDWGFGDWGVSYHFEWLDSITEFGSPFGIFGNNERFKVDSQSYHDLMATYNFGPTNTRVSFGINNFTDEEAPFINQGFNGTTEEGTYRVLGRNYFLRLTQRF